MRITQIISTNAKYSLDLSLYMYNGQKYEMKYSSVA